MATKWFECAPTNDVLPPTDVDITAWINRLETDADLRQAVWHRYVLTRGGTRKFSNWLRKAWFFRNATKQNITHIESLIIVTS